jgi:hypothetical protein
MNAEVRARRHLQDLVSDLHVLHEVQLNAHDPTTQLGHALIPAGIRMAGAFPAQVLHRRNWHVNLWPSTESRLDHGQDRFVILRPLRSDSDLLA